MARRTKLERLSFVDNGLQFDEAQHKYSIAGEILRSVSEIVKTWTPEFDPDGSIRKRKASELGMSVEDVGKMWDFKRNKSLKRGTQVHTQFHEYWETGKTDNELVEKVAAVLKIDAEALFQTSGITYLSELRLSVAEDNIAGTCDLLIHNDETGEVILIDYKTNERLSKFEHFGTLKPPLNHIPNCDFYKYILQMCLYAHILERRCCKVVKILIIHIDHENNVEFHDVMSDKMFKEIQAAVGIAINEAPETHEIDHVRLSAKLLNKHVRNEIAAQLANSALQGRTSPAELYLFADALEKFAKILKSNTQEMAINEAEGKNNVNNIPVSIRNVSRLNMPKWNVLEEAEERVKELKELVKKATEMPNFELKLESGEVVPKGNYSTSQSIVFKYE